jgi:hypothetical protein
MPTQSTSRLLWVCLGDLITLGLVTLIGFATHGELAGAGPRLLTTFLPLTIAWALIGFWVGVFDLKLIQSPTQLWRPVCGMLLAAPMAGWLRGWMLGAPILPIFVLVLGATSAAGLLTWRSILILIMKPTRPVQREPHG